MSGESIKNIQALSVAAHTPALWAVIRGAIFLFRIPCRGPNFLKKFDKTGFRMWPDFLKSILHTPFNTNP
jgi:hypothetical protein